MPVLGQGTRPITLRQRHNQRATLRARLLLRTLRSPVAEGAWAVEVDTFRPEVAVEAAVVVELTSKAAEELPSI